MDAVAAASVDCEAASKRADVSARID